ncbi:integral component of membrane [Sergentomyia squamirostris]
MEDHANSKGAMAGAFAAIGSLLILIIGSINYKPEPTLPFRIDGCENPPTENYSNSTLSALDFTDTSDTHWPFKLNFTYYGFTGPTVGLIVGCLTSWLTGGHRVTNEKLLAPFLRHKCRPEEEIRLQDT